MQHLNCIFMKHCFFNPIASCNFKMWFKTKLQSTASMMTYFIGQPGSEHYSSFSLRYHVHGMLAECLMNNAHKMENTLGVFQVVMWLVEFYKISARRALCPLMVHLETKPLWCQTPQRNLQLWHFPWKFELQ